MREHRAQRPEDLGLLWEHFVLNELNARSAAGTRTLYWRSKHGNEVDFVLSRRGRAPIAIECKWSAEDVDLKNLGVFRKHYPEGESFVVVSDADRPIARAIDGIEVRILGLDALIEEIR